MKSGIYYFKVLAVTTLVMVCTLIVGTQFLSIYLTQHNEKFAIQINLSGRQRMLSQKIAKIILSADTANYHTLANDLKSWHQVHLGLINGDTSLQLPPVSAASIQAQLSQLTPIMERIDMLVSKLLVGDQNMGGASDSLKIEETRFLAQMDKIVFSLQSESEEQSEYFEQLELLLTVLSIILITISIVFIFFPLYRKMVEQDQRINDTMQVLTRLNGELESKVEELGTSNNELQTAEEELRCAHEEQVAMTEELENRMTMSNQYIHQLSAAQEIAGIGFWSYDLHANIKWSDQMYHIFNICKREGSTGPSLEEYRAVIHPDDLKVTQKKAQEAIKIGKVRYQIRIINPAGEVRHVDSTVIKNIGPYGETLGIFGISRDITDDVNVNTALIQAKEAAENIAKIKQDFLANISHEIRTPMNAILGFTRLLLQTNQGQEQMEYLQSIYDSADTLLVVIDDILDFSKIQAGKFIIEKVHFNPHKLLASQQKLFSVKVDESDILLRFETDPNIPTALLGDPTRINQILNNLIGNAVKFTKRGEVAVKTSIINYTPEKYLLELAVSDTGIGISKDKIGSIFNSFEQENGDTSRLYGGTGLGLTIVKKLVELMDGEIQVESELGKGTTFSVRLTFGLGDESQIDNDVQETFRLPLERLNGCRILLAEDNRNNQLLAKKCLVDVGCEVDIASNGQEAIQKLVEGDYHIILMDVQMPVLDGIEATKKIKALPSPFRDVPIIAMTAHALKEEESIYRSSGMCEYVSKPFKPEPLYGKLLKVLNGETWHTEAEIIHPQFEKEVEGSSKVNSVPWDIPDQEFINYESLELYADGDQDFIHTMLSVFAEDAPEYVGQLEVAMLENNWLVFKKTVHALKSSISFLGLNATLELIDEIENLQESDPRYTCMEPPFNYIKDQIQQALENINNRISE